MCTRACVTKRAASEALWTRVKPTHSTALTETYSDGGEDRGLTSSLTDRSHWLRKVSETRQGKIRLNWLTGSLGITSKSCRACSTVTEQFLMECTACACECWGESEYLNACFCVLSPLAVAACRASWRWRAASAGRASPCFSAGWDCSVHWSPAASLGEEEDAGTYSSPWSIDPEEEEKGEGQGGWRHDRIWIRIARPLIVA